MLVGTDVNNQNTTIFERSTMPGLALLGPNGKVLKTVDLLGIVAVKSSTFFSSGAQAHFIINYSSVVGDTGKVKGRVIDITIPMVSNGTLALAALPPLRMLDQEIFSSHKVCGTAAEGCHDVPDNPLSQGQQRSVDWTVNAHVTITAPGFQPLTLMGSSGAVGEFNWDGSFYGGCTDCGGTSGGTTPPPTIGGANLSPTGTGSLTDKDYVEPPGGEKPTGAPCAVAGTCTSTSTTSTTVSSSAVVTAITTTKIISTVTGKTVREFKSTSTGTSRDYSGTTTATEQGRTPGTKSQIAVSLLESPFGYSRLDLTWLNGNVYLLNPAWFILGIGIFAALAVVLFALLYLRPKEKKQRRK
jgi:hypothetical protein